MYVQLRGIEDIDNYLDILGASNPDSPDQPASPFSITIIPGRISAAHCIATGEALLTRTAGEEGSVSISVSDAFGNTIAPTAGQRAGFNVAIVDIIDISILYLGSTIAESDGTLTTTYTIERAGQYRVNILYVGEQIICGDTVCPSPLVVAPDVITSEQSSAEGEGIAQAGAGITAAIIVSIRDQYSNLRSAGGDQVVATLQVAGASEELTVTDNDDGTYGIEYVTTVAGSAVLGIQTFINSAGSLADITASPFTVTVRYGTPVASAMTALGNGLEDTIAGSNREIALRAYDAYNNVVYEGGGDLVVTLYNSEANFTVSSADPPPVQGSASVADAENGRYTISYVLYPSGTYVLSAILNGEIITAVALTNPSDPTSTRNVFVNYAATDVCFVDGVGDGVAGVPMAFTLQSMDAFGNPRLEDSDVIVVSRGNADNVINVETVYVQDGLYSVTYTQGMNPADGQGAGQFSLIVRAGPDVDSLLGTRTTDGSAYSPFQLVVVPGTVTAESVRVRTSDGGLYAANAGEEATFGIIAQDVREQTHVLCYFLQSYQQHVFR